MRLLRPSTAGLVGLAVLCALHVLWFVRFRDGGLTDLDEAGYVALGLHEKLAWSHGLEDFARTATYTGTTAPLVPFATVPLYSLIGEGLPAAWTMMVLCFVWLSLATYALARRFMSPGWALLATATVAAAPVVTDYTRIYHFAVPAAAAFTTSVWLLLRSDRLLRRRWAVMAGLALGVTLLTRIMTVAYAPAIVLAAVLLVARTPSSRGARAANAGLLVAAALAVAFPWYYLNRDEVATYLTSKGYGEGSGEPGTGQPLGSASFWLDEMGRLITSLGLPFLLVVLVVLTGAAARRRWRQLDLERGVLIVVCAEGYLVLTSTANAGTAFALPWLPCLVVLATAAASRVAIPRARTLTAAAILLAAAGNVVAKNGVSSTLSNGTAGAPGVRISDKRLAPIGVDPVQRGIFNRGLPVAVPPDDEARAWGDFNELLVRRVAARAARERMRPCVTAAAGDWVLEGNRLRLAAVLAHIDVCVNELAAGDVRGAVDTAQGALLTIDPVPHPRFGVDVAAVAAAARAAGYRVADTLRAPDGRRVRLWWRPPPSP